jgi:hypothetical protein
MKTTNDRAVAHADGSFSRYVVGSGSPSWLRRWYGLVIAGAVTAGIVALALSQHWLAVADLSPLLFILPCAVSATGMASATASRQGLLRRRWAPPLSSGGG